jgi:hypothetical protein
MKGTEIQSWIKNAGIEKAGTLLVLFRQAATGHAHADRVTALLSLYILLLQDTPTPAKICKYSRPLSPLPNPAVGGVTCHIQ